MSEKTEERQEKSEEYFRTLIENSVDAVLIVDGEGKLRYGSPANERALGWTAEETTWSGFLSRVHPEDAGGLTRTFDRVADRPGTRESFTVRCRHKDGSWRTIEAGIKNLLEDPTVRGFVLNYQDITGRSRAEEAYRKLTEGSVQGFAIYQNFRIVFTNQAFADILGREVDQILSASPEEVAEQIHPEDRAFVIRNYYDRLQGKPVPGRYEFRILRSDGSVRWVDILASLIEFRGRPAHQVTYYDITERKRAEEALRESEEKYRLLVENANDSIFILQDGHMRFHNRRTEELTGHSARALAEIPFVEHIHPEDRKLVVERHMKRLGGEDAPNTYSFRICTATGQNQIAQVNAVRIQWESRPAVLCFVRDITELKKLESHLQQSQKMEAVGTLAGGIAHDFNNILAIINGYSELAMQDPEGTPKVRACLEEILKAGIRGRDLSEQILTFSRRSERGRKPVDILKVTEDALRFLRASLPATIEIRKDFSTPTATILGDSTQIHQVLMNLGSNAGHAMRPAGGVLQVTLKEVVIGPEGPDQDLPPGRYVELSVIDTGHGMEKEVLDRIFDPFFTTKKLGEGTGLGLSVAHGIVKNHQGAIRVFSSPGRGTAFHVLLPRIEQQAACDPEPLRRVSNGKANLLFVDDEASIVQLCQQMLEGLGYKVTAHTDSREALEAFRAQPGRFDLVITDLTMPGLTGIDLFREITAIRPDTPVILCTGFHDAGRPEQMFRAFLTKPILMHELSETVQEVLRPPPPR